MIKKNSRKNRELNLMHLFLTFFKYITHYGIAINKIRFVSFHYFSPPT
jgi:hypothetical protein